MKTSYETKDKAFLRLRGMDDQDENGHQKEKQFELTSILGDQNCKVL